MTRLRLHTDTGRLIVGYDAELATYYLETGPTRPPSTRQDDQDEGLTTIRGRP